MSVLRITSLSLLLAGSLVFSACGNDDATSSSGTGNGAAATEAPAATSAAAAEVEKQIPAIEKDVQNKVDDRRERLEKITKDIQSGKVTPQEGQEKIDDVVKEIESDTGDLTKKAAEEAASAGAKSGEKVTELQLDGGDDK